MASVNTVILTGKIVRVEKFFDYYDIGVVDDEKQHACTTSNLVRAAFDVVKGIPSEGHRIEVQGKLRYFDRLEGYVEASIVTVV